MILFKNSENVKDIEEIQLNNLRVITNQIITMSKTMSKHIEYIPEMIVNFFKRYSFDDLASKFFQDVICLCECWLEQSPNDSNFYILITKNYDKIKNDEKFIDFRNNEIAREIELFRNIPIKFAEKLYSKIYELSFNYGLKPKEISEKLQNEFIPETLEGMIKELALPESSKIFINFTKFKYKQPLENVRKKIEKIENHNRDNFSIEKLSEIEKEIKENISKLEEIEIEFEKAKESIVKYKILDRTSFFEDELKELEYISKKAFNLLYKISKEKEKIHCIVKDVGEIDPNPPYGKHGINGQYVKKTEAEQKKIEEKIEEKKESEKKENTKKSNIGSEAEETTAEKANVSTETENKEMENMQYLALTEEEKENIKRIEERYNEHKKQFESLEQETNAIIDEIKNLIKQLYGNELTTRKRPPSKEELEKIEEKLSLSFVDRIKKRIKYLFENLGKLCDSFEMFIKKIQDWYTDIQKELSKFKGIQYFKELEKYIKENIDNFVFSYNFINAKKKNLAEKLAKYNSQNAQSEQSLESIKEKKEFLENTLNISNVFYDTIFEEVATAMNSCLKMFYYKFPLLKKEINGVGELTDLYDYMQKRYEQAEENYKNAKNEENKNILDSEKRKFNEIMAMFLKQPSACFYPEDQNKKELQGIYVNSKALKEYKASENFHPQGCNNLKGYIAHELFHQVDLILELFESETIKNLYNNLYYSQQLSSKLCNSVIPENNANSGVNYYREFVAEALAEYFMSESPREVAMKVGFLMEAEYRKKYG